MTANHQVKEESAKASGCLSPSTAAPMEDEKPVAPAHAAADEVPRDTAPQDGIAPDDTTTAVAAEHATTTSRPISPTDSTAAVKSPVAGILEEERRGSLPDGSVTAAPAGFVAPSSYLRPAVGVRGKVDSAGSKAGVKAMHPLDKEQIEGLVSAYECVRYGDTRLMCDSARLELSSRSGRRMMCYRSATG